MGNCGDSIWCLKLEMMDTWWDTVGFEWHFNGMYCSLWRSNMASGEIRILKGYSSTNHYLQDIWCKIKNERHIFRVFSTILAGTKHVIWNASAANKSTALLFFTPFCSNVYFYIVYFIIWICNQMCIITITIYFFNRYVYIILYMQYIYIHMYIYIYTHIYIHIHV